MLETVRFQLGECPNCGPDVLLAADLDERDELVPVCAHCGARLEEATRVREVGPSTLLRYGYDVEGERDELGCGSCGGSCGVKG